MCFSSSVDRKRLLRFVDSCAASHAQQGAAVHLLSTEQHRLDLSCCSCQLTDQLLLKVSTHLHKVQVLDLSHNNITDASTDNLLQLVSINPSMDTCDSSGTTLWTEHPLRKTSSSPKA
ncbi:hypothetical protein VZT92_015767 [Zoarces viviparus]|uniref:Uncharacterized protein n=1 Tax=Zoarces viviparus TaxID=48416 RepID=A0AAW1EWM8_ZOAVI